MKSLRPGLLASVALMTGFALLFAAKPASAQLPIIGGPAALSAGVFLPADSVARAHGGDLQLDVEARYALPSIPFTGTRTIATLGIETGAADGEHSTIVPATVGLYAGGGGINPLRSKNTYVGAGIGEYFINQSGISTTARTGGFVAVGYNTPAQVFAEAKYQIVGGGDGAEVTVGIRF